MKTQEQIDQLRAQYKKRWDLDIQRMEAKRALWQTTLDAIHAANRGGTVTVLPQPGELFAGEALKREIEALEEDIAYRAVQWQIVQDEFDAADSVRLTVVPTEAVAATE